MSTIDEILALVICGLDFELDLNKCGDGLLSHITSNHEGGKNSCEHYEYKTNDKSIKETQRFETSDNYFSNQCKYHSKQHISLKKHKESKH